MRKISIGMTALAVLIVGSFVAAEEGSKWLDPANCYFCQPLVENENLLDNLSWEHSKIKNGIVAVTTYTSEWKETYQTAHAAMMKRWTDFDPSQEVKLCGMCEAWMTIPMDKIAWETVTFNGGEVGITTTNDPEVLAKLHELTDKTIAEMAAIMEEPEGHEH